MRKTRFALCATCRRHVPIRKDGRLRAHLARRGQREQCAGSGQFSARLEIVTGGIARPAERPEWMTAAEFNAVSEWAKADGLYDEWKTMELAGAASPAALASAEDAFRRAWRDAQQLEAALPDGSYWRGLPAAPEEAQGR